VSSSSASLARDSTRIVRRAARPARQAAHRLATLHRYQILDKTREAAFNDITCPAAMICGTPMALISLVDHDRQWFKKKWVWG
jgi:hypothetical protein